MDEITLTEASRLTGFAYITLYTAVRDNRIASRRSGSTYLVTMEGIQQAINNGRLRPERMKHIQ